jgi:glutamyl-tRNA synthetase
MSEKQLPGAVRLRVAPSPTGDPHVGTAYMSMFDLAFARQQDGRFLLRIEDTDRARLQEDSERQIYDTLHWLGLTWDEGPDIGGPCAPYRQSERLETYRPFVERLLEAGHAYLCWCSAERLTAMREDQQRRKVPTGYDRLCLGKTREERAALPGFSETPVVRMQVPDDVQTSFDDLIAGRIDAPVPDDQVILKADGFPTYHLAVVVDDHLMGITHVVRGQEWISSTPKHLLLYRWLGIDPPAFAHMPLLRDERKAKISKRKSPWARLTWFREQGYLPEALVNFLALQGYPPDRRGGWDRARGLHLRRVRGALRVVEGQPCGVDLQPRQTRLAQRRVDPRVAGGGVRLPVAAVPRGRRDLVGQPVAGRSWLGCGPSRRSSRPGWSS